MKEETSEKKDLKNLSCCPLCLQHEMREWHPLNFSDGLNNFNA